MKLNVLALAINFFRTPVASPPTGIPAGQRQFGLHPIQTTIYYKLSEDLSRIGKKKQVNLFIGNTLGPKLENSSISPNPVHFHTNDYLSAF